MIRDQEHYKYSSAWVRVLTPPSETHDPSSLSCYGNRHNTSSLGYGESQLIYGKHSEP